MIWLPILYASESDPEPINLISAFGNFLFIKEMIDKMIQELINKLNIIPYSLKCLCKLISILIECFLKFDLVI